MSTLGERIKYSRESKGLLQGDLAKLIGVKSAGIISNWERDLNKPDAEKIVKLCDVLNISASYLLNYYGKSNFEISPYETDHIKKYRLLDSHGKETVEMILDREAARVTALREKDIRIAELQAAPAAIIELHKSTNEKSRLIEYFRSVSAGTGQVIFDDVYSERITMPDIPEYRRVAYAVKVDGRSMEPLYNDGDILLIEPTCEIDIGEIGIFNVNGLAYVKQLGQDRLISLNKGYGDVPLTEDSVCMGRVVDKLKPE